MDLRSSDTLRFELEVYDDSQIFIFLGMPVIPYEICGIPVFDACGSISRSKSNLIDRNTSLLPSFEEINDLMKTEKEVSAKDHRSRYFQNPFGDFFISLQRQTSRNNVKVCVILSQLDEAQY